jgi:hypothetical protein
MAIPGRETAEAPAPQAGSGSGATVQASTLVPQVEALLHQAARRAEQRNREQAGETTEESAPSERHGGDVPAADSDEPKSPDDSAVKE